MRKLSINIRRYGRSHRIHIYCTPRVQCVILSYIHSSTHDQRHAADESTSQTKSMMHSIAPTLTNISITLFNRHSKKQAAVSAVRRMPKSYPLYRKICSD